MPLVNCFINEGGVEAVGRKYLWQVVPASISHVYIAFYCETHLGC